MKTNYIILKDNNLIIETVSGTLSMENMKANKKLMALHKYFSPTQDLLIDLRETKIDITIDQFTKYIHYLLSKDNMFSSRKSAILISTANQRVYLNQFKSLKGSIPLSINLFSCLDETIQWLDKNELKEEIPGHIETLKSGSKFLFWGNNDTITGF